MRTFETDDNPRFQQQVMRTAGVESVMLSIDRSPAAQQSVVGDHKLKQDSFDAVPQFHQIVQPDWSFLQEGILFGRDEEIRVLQHAFQSRIDRAGKEDGNRAELVLVSGK
jgi:predicted oxidoreductase